MKSVYIILAAIAVLSAILWFTPGFRNILVSEESPTPTSTPASSKPSGTPPLTPDPSGRMVGEALIVQSHAATQYNVRLDQVLILEANPKEWPNGCLGLPKTGEFCTEALVQGWEIKVQIKNGQAHTYRTNIGAIIIRQEN